MRVRISNYRLDSGAEQPAHLRPPPELSCRRSASSSDALLPLPPPPVSVGVRGRFSWSALLDRDAKETL